MPPAETDRDVPTIDEARAHFAAYLERLPLKGPALAVLDFVEAAGDREFFLEEAVEAAGKSALDGEIMAVMSLLTSGRRSPLQQTIVFRDEQGRHHPVEREALIRARDEGLYAHPLTGRQVPEPEKSFYMRFAPRPGLLEPTAPRP